MNDASTIVAPTGFEGLSAEHLGQLMPMFLLLDMSGKIYDLGPTLRKILGTEGVIGTAFARHFSLRRARGGRVKRDSHAGARRLSLSLVRYPEISLRGVAVELGPKGARRLLVNLSFGIHLAEAVREFGLTEADFSASDLAMEMLYMIEAKRAVLAELTALTQRLEEARHAAMSQALTDPLTGLANRRAFDAALEAALADQRSSANQFAIAHVDLDFFKAVNDTFGHAAGDAVLVHAATVLSSEVRRGDLVARVGGDEFVLLVLGLTSPERVESLVQRIIARIEEPILFEGSECRISASVGIALSSHYAAPTMDRMLSDADQALYRSKRNGRGCYCIHD